MKRAALALALLLAAAMPALAGNHSCGSCGDPRGGVGRGGSGSPGYSGRPSLESGDYQGIGDSTGSGWNTSYGRGDNGLIGSV